MELRTDPALNALAARRLNVGCGEFPLPYYTNLDASEQAIADLYVRVPPIPYADGALDEIVASHFLEHLSREEAAEFVRECRRCLAPAGTLLVVVPDTREVMRRWLGGTVDAVQVAWNGPWFRVADLDDVCAVFLYSTTQASPHRWSYDRGTLARLLTVGGFEVVREVDRYTDPRIPCGAWYQVGLEARPAGGAS